MSYLCQHVFAWPQGDSLEWSPSTFSSMASTCAAVESSCKNFQQGTWQADGKCLATPALTKMSPQPVPSPAPSPSSSSTGDDRGASGPRCLIAPGAIGGAHQLASSMGYSTNCSGTLRCPIACMEVLRDSTLLFAVLLPSARSLLFQPSHGLCKTALFRDPRRRFALYVAHTLVSRR